MYFYFQSRPLVRWIGDLFIFYPCHKDTADWLYQLHTFMLHLDTFFLFCALYQCESFTDQVTGYNSFKSNFLCKK